MASRHRVSCVKPDGNDLYSRIDGIGGVNGDGTRWYLDEDKAIAGMDSGKWEFFVSVNNREVEVIVAERNGRRYLKTEADGYSENNLSKLPTCP